MQENKNKRYSYIGFVKEFPDHVLEMIKLACEIEPDPERFQQLKRRWNTTCMPPQHYKLAQKLVMRRGVDPKDLVRGTGEQIDAMGLVAKNFFLSRENLTRRDLKPRSRL